MSNSNDRKNFSDRKIVTPVGTGLVLPGAKGSGVGEPELKRSGDNAFRESHRFSDLDVDRDSQHHTLGFGPNQAAPGSDLKNIKDLLEAYPDLVNDFGTLLTDFATFKYNHSLIGMRTDVSRAQSIASNTTTWIALNTYVHHHPDLVWQNPGTANQRGWVIPVAGKYYVTGGVRVENNTSGSRIIRITKNTADILGEVSAPPANSTDAGYVVSGEVQCDVGDIIGLAFIQGSAGTLNTFSSTFPGTFCGIHYLGPKD